MWDSATWQQYWHCFSKTKSFHWTLTSRQRWWGVTLIRKVQTVTTGSLKLWQLGVLSVILSLHLCTETLIPAAAAAFKRPSPPHPSKVVSLWLTHAGDSLGDQVLQESIDDRIVSGVELVSINPNVEAEPVGVGVSCQLPCGAELIYVAFSIPEWEEEKKKRRGLSGVKERKVLYNRSRAGFNSNNWNWTRIPGFALYLNYKTSLYIDLLILELIVNCISCACNFMNKTLHHSWSSAALGSNLMSVLTLNSVSSFVRGGSDLLYNGCS